MPDWMEFPADRHKAATTGMGWTVTRDDGTAATCHVQVEWLAPLVYRMTGTATNPGPGIESHRFGADRGGLVFGTYKRVARKASETLRALAPTEVRG